MFEKRNVRRNPGGVSILTCKSFDTLGEGCERQNRTISQLAPANDSLQITGAASSGKVNDWVNRDHVVLTLFSNVKRVRSKGFFGEPLGSSENPTWANFGKQNWR